MGTRFTPDFIEKLQHFKNLYLTVSCDGYGQAYEYIRYPFTWKMFEKRIKDGFKAIIYCIAWMSEEFFVALWYIKLRNKLIQEINMNHIYLV